MRFSISLIAVVGTVANAAKLESETQIEAQAPGSHYIDSQAYPDGYNYYSHPGYQYPDNHITHSGEELPKADFNRQVWEFDEHHEIWDQNDYEERVKVEAELLVALEALKDGVSGLSHDIHQLNQSIAYQYTQIGLNHEEAYENMEALIKDFSGVW